MRMRHSRIDWVGLLERWLNGSTAGIEMLSGFLSRQVIDVFFKTFLREMWAIRNLIRMGLEHSVSKNLAILDNKT